MLLALMLRVLIPGFNLRVLSRLIYSQCFAFVQASNLATLFHLQKARHDNREWA